MKILVIEDELNMKIFKDIEDLDELDGLLSIRKTKPIDSSIIHSLIHDVNTYLAIYFVGLFDTFCHEGLAKRLRQRTLTPLS